MASGDLDALGPEHLRRLLTRESQLVGTDLRQETRGPEPSQPEPRVGAGDDHEVRRLGQVLDQELHLLATGRRLQELEVVEDQHDVVHGRHGVDQPGQDPGDQVSAVAGHVAGDVRGERAAGPVQRGAHVRPQSLRVVVRRVEGDPRRRSAPPPARQPLGRQRGLAVAGRGRDQRDRTAGRLVEEVDQSLPLDPAVADPGPVQLGLEEGVDGRRRKGGARGRPGRGLARRHGTAFAPCRPDNYLGS